MVASAWLERPTMKRTMQHPASATWLSKQHGQEQPATRSKSLASDVSTRCQPVTKRGGDPAANRVRRLHPPDRAQLDDLLRLWQQASEAGLFTVEPGVRLLLYWLSGWEPSSARRHLAAKSQGERSSKGELNPW
ncbi:MAG: hypothetical protein NTZ23_05490 [Cyanobium sp. LacPavin_0920_WC12_MAG_63_22]|nr:hypothetical protein [Cyanobium sp. LacPavin_0920_WC12_MAG_63_22]